MLRGRHDALSWMQDLPRMEAHILDAGHFLLETHAEPALALMMTLIERASGSCDPQTLSARIPGSVFSAPKQNATASMTFYFPRTLKLSSAAFVT
jgi:hypothetical protein